MGEGRLNQFNPGGKDEWCDANIKRFSNLALVNYSMSRVLLSLLFNPKTLK